MSAEGIVKLVTEQAAPKMVQLALDDLAEQNSDGDILAFAYVTVNKGNEASVDWVGDFSTMELLGALDMMKAHVLRSMEGGAE